MFKNIRRVTYNNQDILKISHNLAFLKSDYPNFYSWMSNKVIPNIETDNRKIFLASTSFDEFAGALILKDTDKEKKICTLYVAPNARRHSLGRDLINVAFEELKSNTPLITVSKEHLDDFSKLLKQYKFEFTESLPGYYKPDSVEYTYNGHLYVSKVNLKNA